MFFNRLILFIFDIEFITMILSCFMMDRILKRYFLGFGKILIMSYCYCYCYCFQYLFVRLNFVRLNFVMLLFIILKI